MPKPCSSDAPQHFPVQPATHGKVGWTGNKATAQISKSERWYSAEGDLYEEDEILEIYADCTIDGYINVEINQHDEQLHGIDSVDITIENINGDM